MSHFLHPLDSNSLFKEVIIKHQPRPITIEAAYSDRNIIDKQYKEKQRDSISNKR